MTLPLSVPSDWLSSDLLKAFESAQTNTHRVYNRHGSWIERFGRDFLISTPTAGELDLLLPELKTWCAENSLPVDRVYGKRLADTEQERQAAVLLEGDSALSQQSTVLEGGIKYGLDFGASYSAGFFIDQRANRAVWKKSPPKRMLNCFAYTCSFSVIAALGGAETVSVDLSKKSLERGRGNFTLNGIEPAGEPPRRHRFIADDVFGVIPYLRKRGEKFDGIVLDPPTFARGTKMKTFKVERDFPALLDLALDVAAPHARLLLSTNCTRLWIADLERFAQEAVDKRGLRVETMAGEMLPDIPDEAMPTTLWMTLA
jgi:23S rRNA (cytosine1962-C5)-methyltransferase